MGGLIGHQLKFETRSGAMIAVPASPCGSLRGEFAVLHIMEIISCLCYI